MFGEVFEHFGDGHFDHDFSHGGPSFFSIRILSVFVTAFGGFGAIGIHYGLSILASSGPGFLSGMFFASLIYVFARFLFEQQATTEVRSTDIVSRAALVVVAIPSKAWAGALPDRRELHRPDGADARRRSAGRELHRHRRRGAGRDLTPGRNNP
jgi:hypothetical protein